MAINFQNSRRSELNELREELNSFKADKKREALKKVGPTLVSPLIGHSEHDCGKRRILVVFRRAQMYGVAEPRAQETRLPVHYQLFEVAAGPRHSSREYLPQGRT